MVIMEGWPIGRIPQVLPRKCWGVWMMFLPGSRRKVMFSVDTRAISLRGLVDEAM